MARLILVSVSVSTLAMAVIPIFILHTCIMAHKLTELPWDRDPADMLVGIIGVSYLEEMNYNIHARQFIKDIFFIAKDRLYNRLCQEMKDNEANFPSTMFDSEIRKVVEIK